MKIIQTAGTRWLTYGRASQRILDRLQEVARNYYSHMGQSIQEQNLWKTAFKKFEGVWSTSSRPNPLKFFKGCLPQILLGLFLNTLFFMPRYK